MNYFRHLRLRLFEMGLMPTGKVARTAWYLLGLNLLLFALQKLLGLFKLSYGESLTGWVFFLSFGIIVLFAIVAYRWLKARLLWRLRNRLIVTYVFIGVIPAVLLVAMALITIYLFAGQFANFVVISELNSRLRSLEAANAAIANELATRLERGEKATADSLEGLRRHEPSWSHQEICGWQDEKPLLVCGGKEGTPFSLPSFLAPQFKAVVRDHGKIYLRAATVLNVGARKLTVISSDELDRNLFDQIAAELGEITLYISTPDAPGTQPHPRVSATTPLSASPDQKTKEELAVHASKGAAINAQDGEEHLRPTFTAGSLPASNGRLDREIDFPTPLPVVDWGTGEQKGAGAVAALRVLTRPSILYARRFAALPGDFAQGAERFWLPM